MVSEREWNKQIGIDCALDDCVENLKLEFGLTMKQISNRFIRKAIEIKPETPKNIIITNKMMKETIKQYIEKENKGELNKHG